MPRVLLLSHPFPPRSSSGVFRPTKFVKHLPDFGWTPYVISGCPTSDEGSDETLLGDIPSFVQVWRVPAPHPQPVNRLARLVGWKQARPGSHAGAPSTEGTPSQLLRSLAKRMRRFLLSPLYLLQNPLIDSALYWSFRIVPLARRIVHRERIDVIMTTSPPWSVLISGLLLKWATGKPWVADMRDPWTTDVSRYHVSGTRRSLDRWVERLCLSRASAVIGVTQPWVDDLHRLVGRRHDRDRFHLITNGFDPDDFPPLDKEAPEDHGGPVRLYHPGSVYEGGLQALVGGIERALESGGSLNLRFEFVGYMHPADRQRLAESISHSLFSCQSDRILHTTALRGMQRAHVLLLVLPYDYYPGKIFEYMNAGRPILAITRQGVASKLIERSRTGCVISPDAPDEIAATLQLLGRDCAGFRQKYYKPDWEVIGQFDRRVLSARLAQVLDDCVDASA